jgi:toxin ParE1/3/4
MRASFNSEAVTEAEEATRWYRENGGAAPSLGFTQELKRVVDLAVQQPGIGGPGLHSTRRLHFKRFPYTLFFRIDGEFLRVLAIAHQSRRPGYWVGRR